MFGPTRAIGPGLVLGSQKSQTSSSPRLAIFFVGISVPFVTFSTKKGERVPEFEEACCRGAFDRAQSIIDHQLPNNIKGYNDSG